MRDPQARRSRPGTTSFENYLAEASFPFSISLIGARERLRSGYRTLHIHVLYMQRALMRLKRSRPLFLVEDTSQQLLLPTARHSHGSSPCIASNFSHMVSPSFFGNSCLRLRVSRSMPRRDAFSCGGEVPFSQTQGPAASSRRALPLPVAFCCSPFASVIACNRR